MNLLPSPGYDRLGPRVTEESHQMPRQDVTPIYLALDNSKGVSLPKRGGFQEKKIQDIVHDHPEALPIAEIDPAFLGAIAICTELNTPAGPIDNFLVTPSGLPILVECKLWHNPQARREVVGQVLDYAKELARWSSADIEREVARRGVPCLIDKVRVQHPDIDEAQFHDALSASLARGRCLLLIVGDGIREGVEAIFEHLREQAILHFSFGLVEMPIFDLPDGAALAVPRVLARSAVENRAVVQLPDGFAFERSRSDDEGTMDPETQALGDERQSFWKLFLDKLDLYDPEQPIPRAPRQGYITFPLPAPAGSSWITVYRELKTGDVGLFVNRHPMLTPYRRPILTPLVLSWPGAA